MGRFVSSGHALVKGQRACPDSANSHRLISIYLSVPIGHQISAIRQDAKDCAAADAIHTCFIIARNICFYVVEARELSAPLLKILECVKLCLPKVIVCGFG
jgi:hypothetical protein